MKKFLLSIIASIGLCAGLNAQQALGPGTGIVSPEINADNTVTFRYYNPKAITVEVSGDFIKPQKVVTLRDGVESVSERTLPVDMKEGADGVWTYTSEPLEGELYSYSFIVNGEKRPDPSNIFQNRDVASWTNYFTISAKKYDKGYYYEVHDVPHGTVSKVWYNSPVLNGASRRLTIYTPAGYEDSKTKYPVLYLLHGSG